MASRAFWMGMAWKLPFAVTAMAAAFPHVIPSHWYRDDAGRQAAFAAQFGTLPVPPQTDVLDRYAGVETGYGSGGDFTTFTAGRKMRTRLSIHELRRFYAPYRFKSALYTLPFDGTEDVPVEIFHDGNLDASGRPGPGGMVVRVEIRDVAQGGIIARGQCVACGG